MALKSQLVFGILLTLLLSACGGGSTAPDEGHRLEGVLVTAPDQTLGEGVPVRVSLALAPSGSDTVYVSIRPSTTILVRQPGGSLQDGGISDLAKGVRVQVWAAEEVRLSDPAEFTATRIEVQ